MFSPYIYLYINCTLYIIFLLDGKMMQIYQIIKNGSKSLKK